MKNQSLSLGVRLGLDRQTWMKRLAGVGKSTKSATPEPGASPEVRRAELVDFYDHFEQFVEVLCTASQFGDTPRLAEKYMKHRLWLLSRYKGLQPLVLGYLRPVPDDSRDAIQGLLGQPTLGAFLKSDDGLMIARITLGREALSLYGEHLRQLAS